MINRETLALMRPDAILINTCRGPVVDEAAVAEALDAGRLWGYGADVTRSSPRRRATLIGRPDVMLTPHSAAQTEEGLRNMATTIAEEVVGVLRGTPPAPGERSARSRADPAELGLEPLYRGADEAMSVVASSAVHPRRASVVPSCEGTCAATR